MKKLMLSLSGLALAVMPLHLSATTLFNFSFTGNSSVSGDPLQPFSGMGQFITTEVGTTDTYKITGVTGTTDGQTISSIVKVGGFGFNDNMLFYTPGAATATLDNSGVAYLLADKVDVSLFLSATAGAGDAQQIFGVANGSLVSEEQTAAVTITPAAAAAPEPASLVLLGTGMLGLVGAARRRLAA